MAKAIDLTNKTFGRWTVLYKDDSSIGSKTGLKWYCQCSCENKTIRSVSGRNLRNGTSTSCGCKNIERNKNELIDLTGKKFGHLKVLFRDNSKKSSVYWICECDCSAKTKISVYGGALKDGRTRSCGCILSRGEEKISKILSDNNIVFEKQKYFSNFKYKETNGYAKFDFYLPEYNCLIEYDGSQHFSYRGENTWNNKTNFNITKQHDIEKNNWCKENNINLIRIPYWHYNDLCLDDLLVETSKFIVRETDEVTLD